VIKRILVIRLGALGDFVLSFGPFAAIRAAHPDAEITLLTTAPFAVLAAQSPWFDRVEIDARPKLYQLPGQLRLIRQLWNFDLVYDLQTSGRSNRYFWLAGAPDWSGIAPFSTHQHRARNRTRLHTILRQRDQLLAAGISEFPAPELGWLEGDITRFALPPHFSLVVPGAAPHRPEKRWPAEQFGIVATALNRAELPPVIIGTGHESGFAATIREICPQARDLTGQTSLGEVAGLARHAGLVIGNDTGPLHLAAAVGAKCVVLFGAASNPARTAPCGDVTIIQVADLKNLSVSEVLTKTGLPGGEAT
jgi:ADP-heptose:LPS heptosyltransferase